MGRYLDIGGTRYLLEQLHDIMEKMLVGDVDLSDYVTKTELQKILDELNIDIDLSNYVTKEELEDALADIDTSNIDLSAYATKEYVTDAINNAELGGDGSSVDLSIYAKKTDLDAKAEKEHTHTMSDITDYTAPDLSSYAKKTDIPSLSGYATKAYVDQNKFSGSYNDLTDKPTIPSIDGLATTEYVDNAVSNIPTDKCVIKGLEKDITSNFISPRTVTECELPALPTFEGGTKLYAQTSVLPNSKVFAATMRDKHENLKLENYVLNEGNYVTLPDTTDGYVDDYIFYGMDLTIGENNPTTIPSSYFKAMVIGRNKDFDSEILEYTKYEYVDVTRYDIAQINRLISSLGSKDKYWSNPYINNVDGYIGEINNGLYYNVSEVQGEMNFNITTMWETSTWFFIDDVFYKKFDVNGSTKKITIDVSNASKVAIVFISKASQSPLDTIYNSITCSYPTYENITLNFYTESLDGTQKSDVHTLEFGEGKTMPITDFDKSKILRYSSDAIIRYIDEPLVDYVSEKIYTKTEVNKLVSGYATKTYVNEKVTEISGVDLSNYYTKSETDALVENVNIDVAVAGVDEPDATPSTWYSTADKSYSAVVKTAKYAKYRFTVTNPDGTTKVLYTSIARGADGINGTNGVDGEDGTDGITPHIDETTKHWFIGETDTGVLAEGINGVDGKDGTNGVDGTNGQDGADGYTPVRGTDYWTEQDIQTIKDYIDTELGVIENGSY